MAQFIAVETHGGVVQSRKQGLQTGTRAGRTFKSLLPAKPHLLKLLQPPKLAPPGGKEPEQKPVRIQTARTPFPSSPQALAVLLYAVVTCSLTLCVKYESFCLHLFFLTLLTLTRRGPRTSPLSLCSDYVFIVCFFVTVPQGWSELL